ncbi:STAS/SEC14 domain-containing protein [Sphingomonas aerophila]|uniref:STAS/SEC14 domain-containing protein n=1 Tax=Sphingomonas aerophila TaxID=1344948 RepID=A0A7W9BBV2_9SPHN|nr:STAS/SEC14 domain-containing protein [Sphingomonas aerophila]MBB5714134.1 hypothetical protein [Sphingomonas aerophila]
MIKTTADELWRFDLDTQLRFLRITLRGFWTEAVLDRYEPILAQQMRANKLLGGETSILVDTRELQIQSLAVAERQQAQLAELKPFHATRCALLVPGALAKMQASRIGSPVDHKVFSDEDSAMAWLGLKTS